MALTISEYIIGSVGFDIPDTALASIYHKRSVVGEADVSTTTQKTLNLCVADALRWAITMPSGSKRVDDADAGWKHSESSASFSSADKAMWRKMADDIYVANGEQPISTGLKIHRL